METIWLTKLILAYLLTDFILQPKKWVDERIKSHFASRYLYVHTAITALIGWIFIGWKYWAVALVILVTHTLIDGWKSYQKSSAKYFLVDQFLHLLVIAGCWTFTFFDLHDLKLNWNEFTGNTHLLIQITAFTFLSFPCAILIGQLTHKWRIKFDKADNLENAGRWIGIIERALILVLVIENQFEAIGLLIAAKSIMRFSDNERSEQKTEYLLIGTLISFSLAIVTGLFVQNLI